MGFLESYLRLPRYQRVLLGLTGIVIGWYGPSVMQRLFGENGVLSVRDIKEKSSTKSTAVSYTENNPPNDNQ